MANALLSYPSVDDYLGPAESRFFASGFRRVTHDVGDIFVSSADDPTPGVQATATVAYPQDWSRKKDEFDLLPHVSTVDMLVLGVQLAEVYLTHAYGLTSALRRAARLRRVVLRSGTTPQEDLVGLEAGAKLRSTKPASEAAGWFVSTFDTSVGVMRARCEIEHIMGLPAGRARTYAGFDEALGDAEVRYYGDGFKHRRQLVEDVRADIDTLQAEATVRVEPLGEAPAPSQGIEGEYTPFSTTPLDCFVANLQLVQLLMYELDSIDRRESNTLWMQQTSLQSAEVERPLDRPAQAQVGIVDKHLLPLRGGQWRNVEVVGQYGGIDLRCSFAHELPGAAAAQAS